MKSIVFCVYLISHMAWSIPQEPSDPQHPGYPTRSQNSKKIAINHLRKGSFLFLPNEVEANIPLVVFSHGQALKLENYELLFKRFTGLGFAVFYPKFDKGFFDTDWERMGEDYDNLVQYVLKNYPQIDKNKVVYSGHSKGGYVGLMALGHRGLQNSQGNNLWTPVAGLFYSPAGYEDEALAAINPELPIHLVWPSEDNIIKESLIDEIYNKIPSRLKQKIVLQGYDDLEAGHFFPLSKRAIFGGKNGISPFHYYGILPWTFGALESNDYLYGDLVLDSGDVTRPHLILRSF